MMLFGGLNINLPAHIDASAFQDVILLTELCGHYIRLDYDPDSSSYVVQHGFNLETKRSVSVIEIVEWDKSEGILDDWLASLHEYERHA